MKIKLNALRPVFVTVFWQKKVLKPADLEKYNANYIGGDINGGASVLSQLFTRPLAKYNPYSMPNEKFYICSSSTPPGGGVHDMNGFHAAQTILESNIF